MNTCNAIAAKNRSYRFIERYAWSKRSFCKPTKPLQTGFHTYMIRTGMVWVHVHVHFYGLNRTDPIWEGHFMKKIAFMLMIAMLMLTVPVFAETVTPTDTPTDAPTVAADTQATPDALLQQWYLYCST